MHWFCTTNHSSMTYRHQWDSLLGFGKELMYLQMHWMLFTSSLHGNHHCVLPTGHRRGTVQNTESPVVGHQAWNTNQFGIPVGPVEFGCGSRLHTGNRCELTPVLCLWWQASAGGRGEIPVFSPQPSVPSLSQFHHLPEGVQMKGNETCHVVSAAILFSSFSHMHNLSG